MVSFWGKQEKASHRGSERDAGGDGEVGDGADVEVLRRPAEGSG